MEEEEEEEEEEEGEGEKGRFVEVCLVREREGRG